MSDHDTADGPGSTDSDRPAESSGDEHGGERLEFDDARIDSETGGREGGDSEPATDAAVLSTRPTVKPVLIWLGLTVALGSTTTATLFFRPGLLGDPQLSEIVAWAALFGTVLLTVRLLARAYVLLRTRYVITDVAIRSEYVLFYKRKSRVLPFDRIRGFDVEQNRLQAVLGIGTVSMLTGGTNYSLGFVEFEHVPRPDAVRDVLRDRLATDATTDTQ